MSKKIRMRDRLGRDMEIKFEPENYYGNSVEIIIPVGFEVSQKLHPNSFALMPALQEAMEKDNASLKGRKGDGSMPARGWSALGGKYEVY